MDSSNNKNAVVDYGTQNEIDSRGACIYIGVAYLTLTKSRGTGKLLGVKAPLFYKRGSRVSYSVATLREWLEQFQPVHTTEMADMQLAKLERSA